MADLNKMDRTWLCSVVFMDIANYSSQSVELQMKWKSRFNGYLAEVIREIPESERVMLDTGDGAAVCFLGAPEAAMFAALQLCHSFVVDEREHMPGLRVRIGINLGPVKLVKDINGALNALGDGLNAGQRIMSFASVNQILVSQSFFEVVSRLSDDYKLLFQLKGVEADKHVREHTVYHLTQPGSEQRAAAVPPRAPGTRSRIWLPAGGAAVAVLAVFAAWYFYQGSASANPHAGTDIPNQTSASAAESDTPAPVVSRPRKPKPAASPEEKPEATVVTAAALPPSPEPAPAVLALPDPAGLLQDGKTQYAEHNASAARESFRKAADGGNAQAMVLLGTFYAQGLGGPKSDSDAVRMFRQAAEAGNARGMYNLGLMLEASRGVESRSENQAAGWYTKAANLGDREAAYRLGLMYEEGRGVPRDLKAARQLYARAGTTEASKRMAGLPQQ